MVRYKIKFQVERGIDGFKDIWKLDQWHSIDIEFDTILNADAIGHKIFHLIKKRVSNLEKD